MATIKGTNGKDVIVSLDDDDIVDGRGGNDSLATGAGRDTVFGGTGNDTIVGGGGSDWLHGGAGNDVIGLSDDSRNALRSGADGDVIFGDGFNTYVIGAGIVTGQDPVSPSLQGDDVIYGTADVDAILGDNGDYPYGGGTSGGHDTIFAGNGNDVVYGEGGNDSLSGEGGSDTLWGGEGKDTISGGDGDDVMTGGGGADSINGGSGDDYIVYNAVSDSSGNKIDTVEGFTSGLNYASGDKIDIRAVAASHEIYWAGLAPTLPAAYGAWFQPVTGGVKLMVDSTGDGAADLQVFVQGIDSLKHSDILGIFNAPLFFLGEVNNVDDPVIEAGAASAGDPSAEGVIHLGQHPSDGDMLQIANTGVQEGTYGSIVLAAEGTWEYTLDNSRLATDALAAGETVVETFEVAVTDGLATSNPIPIYITITGANDAALISGTITGSTSEAQTFPGGVVGGGRPAVGQLVVQDEDGQDSFQTGGGTSALGFGTYSVTSEGWWEYTLDNANPAVQGLTTGDAPVDSFSVYAADGTEQVVSVTIIGKNDAPQITSPGAQIVNPDGVLVFGAETGNSLAVSDVDDEIVSVSLSAAVHQLTLDGTSGLTFDYGDGTADTSMAFSGSANDVNAALDGMTLVPTLGFGDSFSMIFGASGGLFAVIPITIRSGSGGLPPDPVPVQILTIEDVLSSQPGTGGGGSISGFSYYSSSDSNVILSVLPIGTTATDWP